MDFCLNDLWFSGFALFSHRKILQELFPKATKFLENPLSDFKTDFPAIASILFNC